MPKPSLTSLIEQQSKPRRAKAKKTAAVPTVVPPPPPESPPAIDTQELRRALFVRRFVTEYLKNGMNGALAYRTVRPGEVSNSSSAQRACELLECEDVHKELARQLKGIFTNADLDEDWVYRQWRSMAHSNIFDYVQVDPVTGKVLRFKLNPDELTLEQQLNIRRLRVDPETRLIVDIQLIDRKSAVDSVAKARKLFREVDSEALGDLAKEITERMQIASKKVRTFDHDTGEEVE